jgi:NADPH2:quinone reductase
MRAVGYKLPGPVDHDGALIDIELPKPTATGRDVLVQVKAVAVNPIDLLMRRDTKPGIEGVRVLGWDAAGIVQSVGPDVTLFVPGDEVAYAGSITRPGANQEWHLIDERLVGRKPESFDWAEAAAMPLTGLTAWEMLFDRLDVRRPVAGATPSLLIIGGAGGVGSMTIQLARQLTDLVVIATASRPETRAWVQELGAHHVIDHHRPMQPQLEALKISAPPFVFSTTNTSRHVQSIAELIAPQGRFGVIDSPATLDVVPFKQKSVSIHWELMYTRSLFHTLDMGEQGRIINRIANLADEQRIRTTLTERLSPINAQTLEQAHAQVASGKMRGKVAVEGWE